MRLFTAERFAGALHHALGAEAVFLSSRVLVMTPRPGTIGAVIDVPFPYPRPPDVRFAPEFIAIVREVSRSHATLLRGERG